MAGTNGLTIAFRTDANVRIHKFTVMVKSSSNTSTQRDQFAALPATGGNKPGVLGVTVEHFTEPPPLFTVAQGTDPTSVTGTTPSQYNLAKRPITLQVNGIAFCIAAGAVAQGDLLVIADQYGRVTNLAGASVSSGAVTYQVGIAEHGVSNANDYVRVLLNFAQAVAS